MSAGAGYTTITPCLVQEVAAAAHDREPVSGWTHNYYRYPARFSPRFAATVIGRFSQPGDLVLDPYMGGGTAIVEGMVAERFVVGSDLNSLATFVAKVKTTTLSSVEVRRIECWLTEEVPTFTYRASRETLATLVSDAKTKNMSLARARFIKKAIAAALNSISGLPTGATRDFAKCVVLRVGQWALDGRSRHTPLSDFRDQLGAAGREMLKANVDFATRVASFRNGAALFNQDAKELPALEVFSNRRASLVITSPPYPGVHVLYHRWQVDGRRETPAPYWITGCDDGQGAAYYNFGDRRQAAADNYFRNSLATLRAIREVMIDGAYMVQLVAFNRPGDQLPRYLSNMKAAGFSEVQAFARARIWREVPNRKWYMRVRDQSVVAREVVLVHRAM